MRNLTDPQITDNYLKAVDKRSEWVNLGRLLEDPFTATRLVLKYNSVGRNIDHFGFSEFAHKLSSYADDMTTEQLENFLAACHMLRKERDFHLNFPRANKMVNKLAETLQVRDDLSPEMTEMLDRYYSQNADRMRSKSQKSSTASNANSIKYRR